MLWDNTETAALNFLFTKKSELMCEIKTFGYVLPVHCLSMLRAQIIEGALLPIVALSRETRDARRWTHNTLRSATEPLTKISPHGGKYCRHAHAFGVIGSLDGYCAHEADEGNIELSKDSMEIVLLPWWAFASQWMNWSSNCYLRDVIDDCSEISIQRATRNRPN